MERDDYTAASRAAWDASAVHHRENEDWRLLTDGFARPGFSCLDAVETEVLETIGVAGRDVAQICCNNARELLSVRNMGAARCVGFHQSAEFLKQGEELAVIASQEIELVPGDVYRIDDRFDGTFDLVVITIGVFGWMPDLKEFMEIPARLLKLGGRLVVPEEHPVVNMFDPHVERPFEPCFDYFRALPLQEEGAIVYDDTATQTEATHWWFFHTLSDVMTAALECGLSLERFDEHPDNISTTTYDIYQNRATTMPMSYLMVMKN
ncbi:MAG: methyltransferase domain-containing protein [Alphaproteobacteria bacterium]|nr:methyltransferase domain-containing protein [Alphaproteobacteria bacterium]